MHGDYKRLRLHSELATAVGVPPKNVFRGENGLPLEITADGCRLRQARAGRAGVRRRGRRGRPRGHRPARPPHALGRRHLHRRGHRLRTGRPLGRAAGDHLPRRALSSTRATRWSTSCAKPSTSRWPGRPRRRSGRSTCSRSHLHDDLAELVYDRLQAPPDGAARRRRGLARVRGLAVLPPALDHRRQHAGNVLAGSRQSLLQRRGGVRVHRRAVTR